MSEHLIRLRGPWELRPASDAQAPPTRIVLPAEALPWFETPITLSRSFGRPARLSEPISCRLRCRDITGWLRITLNGALLAERSPDSQENSDAIEIPIPGPLRPRNRLEVLVGPIPSRSTEAMPPWGSVSLVFDR